MGTKIKCLKCGDIIEGDRQGTFITCKCKACYIDETPYYYRVGGDPEFIAIVKENGEEQTLIKEAEVHLKTQNELDNKN